MAVKKLELIAEKEGIWVRQKDSIVVKPIPIGKPIADVILSFENPYDLIKRHAKKQKLWGTANAYDISIEPHHYFNPYEFHKQCKLFSAHLYRI